MTVRTLALGAFGALWALVACLALLYAAQAAAAAPPDKKAEHLWKAKCASCHGAEGKADTDKGKEMGMRDMSNAAWQKELTDDAIKKAITGGVKREKDGKKQEMDPFADKLKADQIDTLIGYVRSLTK
jgi:mono/diheme cytochrome c family protein